MAHDLGLSRLDPVSAADFLLNGTVCFPYTLIEGIRVAPPGSITRVTPDGTTSDRYFTPIEEDPVGSAADWGVALWEKLREALHFGLDGCQDIRVLFSGGEDARAVAGFLPKDREVTLYTVSDAENREVRLARHAAHKLGLPFVFQPRPASFYRQAIVERIAETGGQFDIRHTHIRGVLADPLRDADAIVGGYAADTLFKSAWMGNVQTARADPFRVERLGGDYPSEPVGVRLSDPEGSLLNCSLVQAVRERRLAHHAELEHIRPRSAGNWHTLWPLGAHRVTYAHLLATRAIGPRVVEPFLDGQVFRLAAQMPDAFRVDRKAFRYLHDRPGDTAALSLSSSGRIPYFNGRIGNGIMGLTKLAWKSGDRLSRYWARLNGKVWIPPGPWGAEQSSFEFDAGDYVSPQEFEDLMASLGGTTGSAPAGSGLSKRLRQLKFRGLQLAVFHRSLASDCGGGSAFRDQAAHVD